MRVAAVAAIGRVMAIDNEHGTVGGLDPLTAEDIGDAPSIQPRRCEPASGARCFGRRGWRHAAEARCDAAEHAAQTIVEGDGH